MGSSVLFKKVLNGAYANLENNKQMVNNLNVFPVPDGDTGTNMSLTIKSAVIKLNECPDGSDIGALTEAFSNGALMGARGNSGVILSQLLRGFAKPFIDKDDVSIEDFKDALAEATKMAYRAVMKPTEGTILTVAREISEFAEANYKNYELKREFIKDILIAGEKSLENTPNLLPVLKEAGVVDAGGKGLLCLFEGALKILNGEEVVKIDVEKPELSNEEDGFKGAGINPADITFAYCTEFLIRSKLAEPKYEDALKAALTDRLATLGDSLLVVGNNGLIKIHIHTNKPWIAMRIAAACGQLSKIKIENMKEQHSELFNHEEGEAKEEKPKYDNTPIEYVIIGVASGSGMVKILKDLGVLYVIEGGQTMNPSTQDFMEIINNTNANNYLLLPNNKNIILAASQAKEMSDKRVEVIETKNIPQAISALMVFDESVDILQNKEEMIEALKYVKTGQVTFAVRDTKIGRKTINEGDFLGVSGSNIVANGRDINEVSHKLLENLVDENSEVISIYYGKDIKEEDANKFKEWVFKKYSDADVELHYGGQPLYYYIVSVE